MRKYKNITFGEDIKSSLPNFKKNFAIHLRDLSEKEVLEAYKIATHGNITKSNKKATKTQSSKL